MADYLAIVNPAAGGGRCGRACKGAIDDLRQSGLAVEVVYTAQPGDARVLASQAWQQGHRHFIAVGGDGTSYEVINGLFPAAAEADENPILGFLPLGTGNSFLRDFSSQGEEHAKNALVSNQTRPCDVVRLEHRDGVLHYINILSIGFVADVNGLRARRFGSWGEWGYILAVISNVAKLRARSFPMKLDGGEFNRDDMLFVSFNNSRFTGGKMMMAPHADPSDGLVDVIQVNPLGRLELLRTFPRIFSGKHLANPAVRETQVREVDFDVIDEIDIMIDGEADRIVPTRIEVLPGAIRVHA